MRRRAALVAIASGFLGLGSAASASAQVSSALGWSARTDRVYDAEADTPTPMASVTPAPAPTCDSHGCEVSLVARSDERDPNRGAIVREVARSDRRSDDDDKTKTPTPTPTVTPTGTLTATPTGTLTATPGATGTPLPCSTETAQNHGEYVSCVAHEASPGPDHGKTVSEAARSDVGKKDKPDNGNSPEDAGRRSNSDNPGRGNDKKK